MWEVNAAESVATATSAGYGASLMRVRERASSASPRQSKPDVPSRSTPLAIRLPRSTCGWSTTEAA